MLTTCIASALEGKDHLSSMLIVKYYLAYQTTDDNSPSVDSDERVVSMCAWKDHLSTTAVVSSSAVNSKCERGLVCHVVTNCSFHDTPINVSRGTCSGPLYNVKLRFSRLTRVHGWLCFFALFFNGPAAFS